MRLETIKARHLISLLVMAGRLGYKDTNSGEYNAVDYLVQEANKDTFGANSASALPSTRSGHGRSETTATPRPSPVEASLGPKRRKADECGSLGPPHASAHPTRLGAGPLDKQKSNNMRRNRVRVGMREQGHTSAMASGKPGSGPGTTVKSVPQPRAAVLQLSNVLKRPYIRHGVCPIRSSDSKQSQGIYRQRIEFVVITDTQLESS
ncbi:hypothetical protein OIDMADRAFT_62302 [Oidiodendron maius Zn]|uniref:Uncharacterized protein n=1 Tax=Oidiodendron maius (strain Zn) TaxID=913774 RepID=A0A0C3G940_OIDMZ|nr:hypothetical protein OIDMADRAFT_62302 [Oidiodendron maius Zn]